MCNLVSLMLLSCLRENFTRRLINALSISEGHRALRSNHDGYSKFPLRVLNLFLIALLVSKKPQKPLKTFSIITHEQFHLNDGKLA